MDNDLISRRVGTLISQLEPLVEDLDRLSETRHPSKAYPPATDADILRAEQKLDWQFPPSYRAFLKMHNGWKNYLFTWYLFGVSGPGAAVPTKQWLSDLRIFEKSYKRVIGRPYFELQIEQKDNPDVIYLPDHPPLATNFDGAYLVFDRNRPRENGEYDIAKVFRGCEVGHRYSDMCQMIEETLQIVRQEIKSFGSDPDAIFKRGTTNDMANGGES